MLLTDLVMT